MRRHLFLATAAILTLTSTALVAQTVTHQTHGAAAARGAKVMGFDQDKTSHHFYLHEDGGAIDIGVKDPKDEAIIHAIRIHLQKVASDFSQGDFSMPHEIHPPAAHAADHRVMGHGATPPATHSGRGDMSALFVPGAAKLSQLKGELRYAFSPTARGGRVDIRTTHADALAALHEFLRFQITEHFTGDTKEITPRK